MKLFVLSGLGICVLCSMCQTRECRPNKGAPWFFFFWEKMYDAFTGNDWTMRWNKWMYDAVYEMSGWCVFFFKMSECTMRFMKWMDDAFLKMSECTMRFMKWMSDAFKSEWMYDAFYVCFFFFFEFVCLLWSCRYEMSCSDETDFHRTMKWSVHLVSWYPIRLVHLRFHRLVVGESPPWLLSVDWTLVTNDVLAHWERVFPSSDYASSLSMYVFMCVIFSFGSHCLRWQKVRM